MWEFINGNNFHFPKSKLQQSNTKKINSENRKLNFRAANSTPSQAESNEKIIPFFRAKQWKFRSQEIEKLNNEKKRKTDTHQNYK